MICSNCGKENQGNASFCVYCGATLSAQKSATQTAAAAGAQATQMPRHKSKSNRAKIGDTILMIMIILVILIILSTVVFYGLIHFDLVEVPVSNEIFGLEDNEEEVREPDKPIHSEDSDQDDNPPRDDDSPKASEATEAPTLATEDPEELAYQNAEQHCKELAESGSYEAAVEYLEECMTQHADDPRYSNLLADYRKQMKDSILSAAEDFADNGQFRFAIQTLHNAWNEYNDPIYYEAAVTYRRDFGIYSNSMIATGKYNTVLVNNDGTVQICGDNSYGELSASYWTDITQVSAGDKHIVGLRKDGTVLAAGESGEGQCNVLSWNNVIAISAGDFHTVGLLENGTLVSTGYNHCDQCNVDSIMDAANGQRIVSIAAGYVHTLALLENGRVAACGSNSTGACNVYGWTDIVSICAGSEFSAGLKADGTVVATGLGTTGWNLSDWTDIVQLSAGDYYLIGLKSDGTVLAANSDTVDFSNRGQANVGSWNQVAFISAGNDHTVAINTDGKIYCIGSDDYGQNAFKGFTLQP